MECASGYEVLCKRWVAHCIIVTAQVSWFGDLGWGTRGLGLVNCKCNTKSWVFVCTLFYLFTIRPDFCFRLELDILDIFATQPILQKEGTSLLDF